MTAREFKAFLEMVEAGPDAAAMDQTIQMTCGTLYNGGDLKSASVERIDDQPKVFIWSVD